MLSSWLAFFDFVSLTLLFLLRASLEFLFLDVFRLWLLLAFLSSLEIVFLLTHPLFLRLLSDGFLATALALVAAELSLSLVCLRLLTAPRIFLAVSSSSCSSPSCSSVSWMALLLDDFRGSAKRTWTFSVAPAGSGVSSLEDEEDLDTEVASLVAMEFSTLSKCPLS